MTPRKLVAALRDAASRWSPRQRQYALLGALLAGGMALLWLVFSLSQPTLPKRQPPKATPSAVTNIGVLPPGGQVSPVDEWVGTAGRKLAQYEAEREEQTRHNKDRQAFEAATMRRFTELEQRLTSTQQAAANTLPSGMPPASGLPVAPPLPTTLPPATPHSTPAAPLPGPSTGVGRMPPGAPDFSAPMPAPGSVAPTLPAFTRISLGNRSATPSDSAPTATTASPQEGPSSDGSTVSTFLPVSFTRGRLLGGLDAPTGGQAQSNPHPVLIHLSDDSVLPNGHRGNYRHCFVIAAGYGDISSERAYLRTESLSCIRRDGSVLEVRIQGSVYGEDGKLGLRGRLVSKQGSILANALLAGVVSGIGQGIATSSSEVTSTPLGSVTTTAGGDAYRAGVGSGVGRALDRLAQYYIKLAEATFPVIEIDASREIDVVITRGVRIDEPSALSARAAARLSGKPVPADPDRAIPQPFPSQRPSEESHEVDD